VRSIYSPEFGMGKKVKVESDFKPATGEFIIYACNYELESEVPGGAWEAQLLCVKPEQYPRIAGAPRAF
jgi:hypothetical protein